MCIPDFDLIQEIKEHIEKKIKERENKQLYPNKKQTTTELFTRL